MHEARRMSARVLGAVLFVLGVVMIVMTVARGGGPLTVGIFIGAAFAFLGALRFRAAGGAR